MAYVHAINRHYLKKREKYDSGGKKETETATTKFSATVPSSGWRRDVQLNVNNYIIFGEN